MKIDLNWLSHLSFPYWDDFRGPSKKSQYDCDWWDDNSIQPELQPKYTLKNDILKSCIEKIKTNERKIEGGLVAVETREKGVNGFEKPVRNVWPHKNTLRSQDKFLTHGYPWKSLLR